MKDKYKTQKNISFHTDRGETLEATLILVVLQDEDDESIACNLEITVDYPTYQQIQEEVLFNLLAQQLLMSGDDSLEKRTVNVGLRLKPQRLKYLTEFTNNEISAEAIANLLTKVKPKSPHRFLLFTENWLAIEFTQVEPLPPEMEGMGELKMGYQTLWAKPERLQSINPINASIKETVLSILQSEGLQCEEVSDRVLRFNHQGQSGNWVCVIGNDEDNDQCVIYSTFPTLIPLDWRKACAVFIANLNYQLTIGNFELDLEDGDLRYRTAIDVSGDRLTSALFRSLLTANLETMDTYFSKFIEFQ